jgi:hypothetical protein
MLSLAIGREGQNARLAAKLTGWRIDIRSDQAPLPEPVPAPEPSGAAEVSAEAAEVPAEAAEAPAEVVKPKRASRAKKAVSSAAPVAGEATS